MPDLTVYLDTNIFIYALESPSEEKADRCRSLMDRLRRFPGIGVTSELTLAETLAPPSGRASQGPVRDRSYIELLVHADFVRLVPIDRQTLYETAQLRKVRPMKLPDAIHVVTAVRTGCTHLVSADKRLRCPDTIVRIDPDEAAMDSLIESLP